MSWAVLGLQGGKSLPVKGVGKTLRASPSVAKSGEHAPAAGIVTGNDVGATKPATVVANKLSSAEEAKGDATDKVRKSAKKSAQWETRGQ